MKARADADGTVFVPNPEPTGPVQYVLICMEPSRSWAGSDDDARQKVAAGFRNFLASMEIAILRLAVSRYLCGPGERYHITDLSKGAIPVDRAGRGRAQRYDRWYPLLREELALVGPTARIIAVGALVAKHLERLGLRIDARVIHYSGLAANARAQGIIGHEEAFDAFRSQKDVTHADLVATTEKAVREARVPDALWDEILKPVRRATLNASRQRLIFIYKTAFESMRLRAPLSQ